MKKIAIVTSTRAEFGLLLPVVNELRKYEDNELKIDLIVTGTHLSEEYGYTIREISEQNIRIDHKIKIPIASSDALDISKNQAETLLKFAQLFLTAKYNAIIILGDRYEMLAVAIAAGNTHTPIFHLCGGDTTEGAIDEWIRHSITKMSYLHFVTNNESYHRVIQLGENPDRVFNYGSTSIDNIINIPLMDKAKALESINMPECDYAVCTYHPVTMEDRDCKKDMAAFLKVIEKNKEIEFIVTKSNADQGGNMINSMLDEASKKIENLHVFSSLGVVRYLSLVMHAMFVLGNSSSGIIEAPALKVPTIDIGDRQKGRLKSSSVINCDADQVSIEKAIKLAISDEFKKQCKNTVSPYGNGNASKLIAEKIIEVVKENNIDLKKKFYNIGEEL